MLGLAMISTSITTYLLPGMQNFILTLSCQDDFGIVAATSTFLTENGGFIKELSQFGDPDTHQFFLRAEFQTEKAVAKDLEERFLPIADKYSMAFNFFESGKKPRVLILVSKQSHCLNDLLHRAATGDLQMDVRAVVSNHPDLESLARFNDIEFHHFPLSADTKKAQEAQIIELIEKEEIELVILARYMQILSADLCEKLKGKAINIHHSFLPSFKGAKPYHQAYARGVKIIGATAHYVTSDLDEGPIIDQEITPVNHSLLPEDLVRIGANVENRTLAKAVKLHLQRRVFIDGSKTVIFE